MHIIHDANDAVGADGIATSIRSVDNLDWSECTHVFTSCSTCVTKTVLAYTSALHYSIHAYVQ
jgi:hypothetical protein